MRFRTLIVALIALTVLVGCSKNSGSGTTNAPPANQVAAGTAAKGGTADPCSLITTADASAVLGEPAKTGAPHSSQTTRQCEWDAATGSVAILVFIGGQKARWSTTYDQSKTLYSTKFKDIPGLGDAAFTNGIDVHVLKGDDMYQIGVAGHFQDGVDRAVTVAKKAMAQA